MLPSLFEFPFSFEPVLEIHAVAAAALQVPVVRPQADIFFARFGRAGLRRQSFRGVARFGARVEIGLAALAAAPFRLRRRGRRCILRFGSRRHSFGHAGTPDNATRPHMAVSQNQSCTLRPIAGSDQLGKRAATRARSADQLADSRERDPDPVGTIIQFVLELVQRLVEDEHAEKRAPGVAAWGECPVAGGVEIAA